MTERRVTGARAFVLHLRPYRETSAIVELLTFEHGRVSVVARGVRGQRRARRADTLAPFTQLLVGWSGRGQLRTLSGFEPVQHHWLEGNALFAGLYLNEVLLRLLRHDDPHQELFTGYAATLVALAHEADIEPVLRRFERLLLRECGYELVLDREGETGEPIEASVNYRLAPESGFVRTDGAGYSGRVLLAVAEDRFDDVHVRRAAKRIMRDALAPHLGDRPLRSRSLFKAGR